MSNPITFAVRKTQNQKLIFLVHGFSGESYTTFGMLPAFIAGDNNLTDYDIYCMGYPTHLAPDITGIWSADPDLTTLSGYLNAKFSDTDLFKQYREIVLIAHSMGGLIVQRALLDGRFLDKVTHVLLFGTPSNGLRKAGLAQIFKRQARDMTFGGTFITKLRSDWNNQFKKPPFTFYAIAGIKDEFVPTSSSVEIFDPEFRSYIEGNHLEMVKPRSLEADAIALVRKVLADDKTKGSGTKFITTHNTSYIKIVESLGTEDNLSDEKLVQLVLALEMTGRQEEGIQLLEKLYKGNSELTGVLAGRLKRRWLADPEGKEAEGIQCYELYKEAYQLAKGLDNSQQAFYNGINVAFMELALNKNQYEAQLLATEVLEFCKQARLEEKKPDKWRLATEGEANLYLGNDELAKDCYQAALRSEPDPRETDSMYKQAIWVARLLSDKEAEKSLDETFHSYMR